MNEDRFKKIDDLNKTLEGVNRTVYTTFKNIEDYPTQEKVDEACIWISEKMNAKLEQQRALLIKTLHEGYIASNEVIQLLEPLVNFDLNIDTVVSAVRKIIDILAGPYEIAVEYVTELTPKLTELATQIALLAYIPANLPQIEGINYNKLNITMKPITIDEIISG